MAILPGDRDADGVRVRRDGGGDPWAKEHRTALGRTFNMNDFDAFMGHLSFAKNATDELFAEYVPDRFENNGELIRGFATIALFDRKKSEQATLSSSVSTAYYLWMCRVISKAQPFPPMFFFVVGHSNSYELIRLDIWSAQETGRFSLSAGSNWRAIWEQAGLIALRQRLRNFIEADLEARHDAQKPARYDTPNRALASRPASPITHSGNSNQRALWETPDG
jgi:hypothetical protein